MLEVRWTYEEYMAAPDRLVSNMMRMLKARAEVANSQ